MKPRPVKAALVLALALSALVLPAAPASATHGCGANTGNFCAYDGGNFADPRLLVSSAGAGTDHVDVANNVTSSGKNATNQRWCGVTAEGWPNDTVFGWAPDTNVGSLGGANNVIDHFYVRTAAQSCD